MLDFSLFSPCEPPYRQERVDVVRLVVGVVVVVPASPVHVAAPHAIVHSRDVVILFPVGLALHVHVLDVPALAFPFLVPEGRR